MLYPEFHISVSRQKSKIDENEEKMTSHIFGFQLIIVNNRLWIIFGNKNRDNYIRVDYIRP